jgi:cell division inhibitor SulA/protein ImuA
MNVALAELLHNPLLWRGGDLAQAADVVPTGFAALDRELPGGGWPRGCLTELLTEGEGVGELRLLLPALRRVARDDAWIALVAPPHIPYAPAFAGYGIDPVRVIVIAAAEDKHRWWAAEQILRANCAGALLFWPRTVSDQRLRRLQLAAQESEAPAFMFASTARAAHASPAPLRIRLSSHHARAMSPATQPAPQLTTQLTTQLRLDIFKRRGGTMSQPLLIDVRLMPVPLEQTPSIAELPRRIEQLVMNRPPSFHRRHPVGAPRMHVWNRALARADEVRRVPGPDQRSTVIPALARGPREVAAGIPNEI